jgi:hypothetical protein
LVPRCCPWAPSGAATSTSRTTTRRFIVPPFASRRGHCRGCTPGATNLVWSRAYNLLQHNFL